MRSIVSRAVLGVTLLAASSAGQAVLYPSTTPTPIALGAAAYTQNFNTLAGAGTSSTLPAGFQVSELGSNANTTYTAGTGSSGTGDVYSFGSAAGERALGSLRSGSITEALYGAFFTNSLARAITGLTLGYTGEQWRNGAASVDTLLFQYSLNATAINNGTWTTVAGLTFTSPTSTPVGALNGNAAANRAVLTGGVSGLSIASGATFAIRWNDQPVPSGGGAQDGLAADDFSLLATFAPAAVIPEPATWAMMIGGFGLVGGALRRRRAGAVLA